MTKLMSIFAAGALAVSLSGMAFAADEKTQNQPPAPKAQDQTGAPSAQDQAKQDQEYLVALKKCEGMQDAAKQKCIDQAKQKYNRM